MAHGKERKEKNCLNCGAQVQGLYCHICGQPNTETRETLWDLFQHFVYDITHFDGKFFSTLRFLLFKPGFLSKEYARGRRMSYLNPVKMYVFTSAIFFLIVFATSKPKDAIQVGDQMGRLRKQRSELLAKLDTASQAPAIAKMKKELQRLDTSQVFFENLQLSEKDSSLSDSLRMRIGLAIRDSLDKQSAVNFGQELPRTIAQYDSLQQLKKPIMRDGFLRRYFKTKLIELNQKYRYKQKELWPNVMDKFVHSLPKMMFISLPFVALLLMLLYIRRKQFTYVAHGIHATHVYIAVYIFFLLLMGLSKLDGWKPMAIWDLLSVSVGIYLLYYLYKSLRVFYGQGRMKTVAKFLLLAFASVVLFSFLALVFVVNSLLSA